MTGKQSRCKGPIELAMAWSERQRTPTVSLDLLEAGYINPGHVDNLRAVAKGYSKGTPFRIQVYKDGRLLVSEIWVFDVLDDSDLDDSDEQRVHSYEYKDHEWNRSGAVYSARRTGQSYTIRFALARLIGVVGEQRQADQSTPENYGDW